MNKIGLTLEDFNEFFCKVDNYQTEDDFEKEVRDNIQIEKALLAMKEPICIARELSDLDFSSLAKCSTLAGFEICQNFSLLLQSLWKERKGLPGNFRVRKIFGNPYLINTTADSKIYITPLTGEGEEKGVVIMKVCTADNEEIAIHESFVSLMATNFLRKKIPNFVFTFGSFYCGGVSEETWCQGKISDISQNSEHLTRFESSYILQEAIFPSEELYRKLRTCSSDQFLNWFLQVLLSINYAHQEIDFTHYDLHVSNVLIRPLPPSTCKRILCFPFRGKEIYIPVEDIAVIIDFAYSHAKIDGKSFYSPMEIPSIATLGQNCSFPLSDAFNLLTCSLEIVDKTDEKFSLLTNLLSYFTDEDTQTVLKLVMSAEGFKLPFIPKTSGSLENFIDFIFTSQDLDFNSRPKNCRILNPDNEVCPSLLDLFPMKVPRNDLSSQIDSYLCSGGESQLVISEDSVKEVERTFNELSSTVEQGLEGLSSIELSSVDLVQLEVYFSTLLDICERQLQLERIGRILFEIHSNDPRLSSEQKVSSTVLQLDRLRRIVDEIRLRMFESLKENELNERRDARLAYCKKYCLNALRTLPPINRF